MKIEKFLSLSWIVLSLNYIFCDVFTLMYSENIKQIINGSIDGITITQSFLLAFAVIMEVPLMMVLLSRILPYRINRISNIVAGLFLMLIQSASLLAGENTLHYYFFSGVEILLCLFIVIRAFRWKYEV